MRIIVYAWRFSWILALVACLLLAGCDSGCQIDDAPPGLNVSLQVVNGTVYLGADREDVHLMYALNARNGAVRWQTQTAGSSQFIVENQRLFLNGTDSAGVPKCTILSAEDGTQLEHGPACPLLQGDILYSVFPDALAAFNVHTMPPKLLWQTSLSFLASGGEPLYLFHGLLFARAMGGIVALRASDGKLLWSFARPVDPGRDVFQEPLLSGHMVIFTVGSPDGTWVYALRDSDGKVLWTYRKPYIFNVTVGPDNIIYINSGQSDQAVTTLEALRVSDGMHLWTYPASVVVHSPFAVAGAFYFEDDTGVYALRASDGKRLWKTPQEDVVEGMADGALYAWIGDTATFASLRTEDGSVRWSISLAGPIANLAVDHGVVYLSTIHATACSVTSERPGALALQASNGKQLWHFHG